MRIPSEMCRESKPQVCLKYASATGDYEPHPVIALGHITRSNKLCAPLVAIFREKKMTKRVAGVIVQRSAWIEWPCFGFHLGAQGGVYPWSPEVTYDDDGKPETLSPSPSVHIEILESLNLTVVVKLWGAGAIVSC